MQSCHVAELIPSPGLHHGGDTLVTTALLRAARSCTRLLTLVHRVQWAGCCSCRCWRWYQRRREQRCASHLPAQHHLICLGQITATIATTLGGKLSRVSGKKYVRISQHLTHTESSVSGIIAMFETRRSITVMNVGGVVAGW